MSRFLRKSALSVLVALCAVSTSAQDRSTWRTAGEIAEGVRGNIIGTVTDLNAGRNSFTVSPDEDKTENVVVDTDAVATQYNGFGGTINGSPEIFVGSTGYNNVRVGDRVDVRGTGRGNGNIIADRITLLGRAVAAPQTGIGQTRAPNSISTPTASQSTPTTSPDRFGRIEGVVRQVNATQNQVTIETDSRQLISISGTSSTAVNYRGDVYRISNLEPGDRIRVNPQSGAMSNTSEIRASSIDVIRSAQESAGAAPRSVGNLAGRVTSIDRKDNSVVVDTGRGNVTVDLTNAVDARNRRIRAADLVAGDQVDLSGSYNGETYVATTVRFGDESNAPAPNLNTLPPPTTASAERSGSELVTVSVYGTVVQSLRNSPTLVVRDEGGRNVSINVLEAFPVRTKNGGYMTAVQLTNGASVAIRAFRDSDGNLIAQTIRIR